MSATQPKSDLEIALESRLRPLEGGHNLRDLGGYPTADGRRVKWGRLFRSAELSGLTEADLEHLAEIPVRTVIDLRRPSEIREAPDRLPASVTGTVHLPITAGDPSLLTVPDRHAAARQMEEVYRVLARDNREAFSRFLALLTEPSRGPVVFHCAAGKDRTGFAAMLFLAALGVDRETILADFLLSNPGLGHKYANWVAAHPHLEPLVVVEPSYLEAGFEVIDQEFGGLTSYLTRHLSADITTLRRLYAE